MSRYRQCPRCSTFHCRVHNREACDERLLWQGRFNVMVNSEKAKPNLDGWITIPVISTDRWYVDTPRTSL